MRNIEYIQIVWFKTQFWSTAEQEFWGRLEVLHKYNAVGLACHILSSCMSRGAVRQAGRMVAQLFADAEVIYSRMPMLQTPIPLRLSIVAVYVLLASRLLHSSHKLKPGSQRLPLALLLVIFNSIAPYLFNPDTEICTFCVVALQLMWLGSFKALGWAINRGPLIELLTYPQFAFTLGMPITPQIPKAHVHGSSRQAEPGNTISTGILGFICKLGALIGIILLLQNLELHRIAQEVAYATGLYLFMGCIMDCLGAVTEATIGLHIAPHFDAPYLSSSLSDYWSRRWNLTVGYTLRFLIYDPVVEQKIIGGLAETTPQSNSKAKKDDQISKNGSTMNAVVQKPPSPALRALGTCAAFFISGVMHEIFILYLRHRISWYWLAFFSLQGPLVVFETGLRHWLRSKTKTGIKPPRLISILVTLSVLIAAGDLLFFPDIMRMRIPDQVVESIYMSIPSEVMQVAGWLATSLQNLLNCVV